MDTPMPTLYTYGVEPPTGSYTKTGKSTTDTASVPLYALAQVAAAAAEGNADSDTPYSSFQEGDGYRLNILSVPYSFRTVETHVQTKCMFTLHIIDLAVDLRRYAHIITVKIRVMDRFMDRVRVVMNFARTPKHS